MDKHRCAETTSDDVTTSFSLESMKQVTDMIAAPPIDTNLQQMNEYCLLEIFSAKKLNSSDLCSIAETCKRFRQVTQRIFPKKIVIVGSYSRSRGQYEIISNLEFLHRRTQNDIERMFKSFGANLSSVQIQGRFKSSRKENFLLNLITEQCNDGNLKRLTISTIKIPMKFTAKLKSIFKQLQSLDLSSANIPDDATMFAKLDSLTELKVSCIPNCGVILENIFPELEQFEYRANASDQIFETLTTFIARHKKLKGLRLNCRWNDNYQRTLVQLIGYSCKELEGLHLVVELNSNVQLQPLKTLKSLRTLSLSNVSFEDLRFFSNLTELRELTLFNCNLPKDSNEFAFWSQLTKMTIFWHSESLDVLGLITSLTNLEELKFDCNINRQRFRLDEKTFNKIVFIVKGRPNVLILKCDCDFNVKKYEENQSVRLRSLWS